jgi:hypothetical protein
MHVDGPDIGIVLLSRGRVLSGCGNKVTEREPLMNVHEMRTADEGICQDIERKEPSKGYSQTGYPRGRLV